MKRHLRPEEAHLWAKVAATVRPTPPRRPARATPPAPPEDEALPQLPAAVLAAGLATPHKPVATRRGPLEPIEPRRERRISREQEFGPRLDLHGFDQDQAQAVLTGFLRRASEDGWRAVLVITGKGSRGEGVLRRRVPQWLSEPGLRDLVAGVSEAHRHHGGAGALYVALKRRAHKP